MSVTTSPCLAFATIVLFLSLLHQGMSGDPDCRLVLSKTNQSLAVRIGSTGELTCQISQECNLDRKRVMGPFWRRPGGDWFVSSRSMYNTRINSTMIALRYARITHNDLGIYICVARIGRNRLRVVANIKEGLPDEGDVKVTQGPTGVTSKPRKKRSAEDISQSFVGVGLVKAAPPRRRSIFRRSLQNPARGSREGNPSSSYEYPETKQNTQPLKTPCDEEEKLFSKTGIIIVAALVCSTFLLLYMVILLMAVPRICFPYYPKEKSNVRQDERSTDLSKDKGSTNKVDIPLTHKVRQNGRSDSGIESVDFLEERGSHHEGGRTGSHWEIGTDRLEEFYRRTTNQQAGSDEDMLSGLKMYNMEKNIPRRDRSVSVPATPYRYQSSIYVKV